MVVLNDETRSTRVIKRGGQHPEWDEEVRFTIHEDANALSASEDGIPPPLPPKSGRGPKKIQGGEKMALACFAADKEPELIGETMVDLTEVLTKGETDGAFSNLSSRSAHSYFITEWFTLHNKDKYSGEVYLELTFWSNVCSFHLRCYRSPVDGQSRLGTTPREEVHTEICKGESTVWWPWSLCSIGRIAWSSPTRQR
jgi:hypothetical protein